jgi:hypothetical protein
MVTYGVRANGSRTQSENAWCVVKMQSGNKEMLQLVKATRCMLQQDDGFGAWLGCVVARANGSSEVLMWR